MLLILSLTPFTKLTRWKGFTLIRRQLGLVLLHFFWVVRADLRE